MRDKRKLFNDVIFETQKEHDNYDVVEYQMMKCYDIYLREFKAFKNLSLANQYFIVHTACLISIGSSMRQLRTFSLDKNKPISNIEANFSIEIDFKEKESLELKEQLTLKQKPLTNKPNTLL